MQQAVGIIIFGASGLLVWAAFTNAGGKTKAGHPIPTLAQQISSVLKGGRPIPAPVAR